MIYMCLGIMTILAIMALVIYRDFVCPLFLFYLPWIASIGLLIFSDYDYNPESLAYAYIAAGGFLFFVGFMISNHGMKMSKRYEKSTETYRVRQASVKCLIILETLIAVYCFFDLYRIYKNFNYGNIYTSIMVPIRQGNASLSSLTPYGLNLISVVTMCMVLAWFFVDKTERRKVGGWIYIQLLIGGFATVANLHRAGVLRNGLTIFVILIICLNIRSRKLFWLAMLFGAGFIIFFGYFTTLKFSDNGQGKTRLILQHLSLYSSGGIVAFEKFFESQPELLWGQQMFRVVYEVAGRVVGTTGGINLIQKFIDIGDGVTTNVYTIYAYYIADFGKIFGLFMQFLLALGYGVIYKIMVNKKAVGIFVFAISIYPLIMQFFAEQYFAMLSQWVQCILVAIVFFETDIFLIRKQLKVMEECKQ